MLLTHPDELVLVLEATAPECPLPPQQTACQDASGGDTTTLHRQTQT